MDEKFLKSLDTRKYDLKSCELPISSYRDLGAGYGEFIPYILAGTGGFQEHKQLNWLNLFISTKLLEFSNRFKKLGETLDESTREITNRIKLKEKQNDMEGIKQEMAKLPENLARMLSDIDDKTHRIEHMECSMEENMYKINKGQIKIMEELRDLKREIKELKEDVKEVKIKISAKES
ncbi:hypothetical protein PVK06_041823 [Gossypium arboreum]|uniref:Uncharacterized protein n=1 Tax=Gossypium arboreum TaxID=29729 RepID=A0ABR0NBG0_GOSAR|nr:hypothetical protein PVK06_041823 [Gossypium arboreum]